MNGLPGGFPLIRVMPVRQIALYVFAAILFSTVGCDQSPKQVAQLNSFPIDNLDGIPTQLGVQFDERVSSDGNGSLRVIATGPTVVRLFELGDIDIEDACLLYRAEIRTESMDGQVYLEMLCHFPGKGEFFSRGLESPLTGSTEWITQEVSFFLKKGENPDNIKLNLVVNGKGTAWIDDIRILNVS